MKTTLPSPVQVILLATMLAIQPCSTHAAPASPSELLEKGIYTEDIKGDIDAAIAIYQQLVIEAKNSQSLGAQAQFRLALCYLKKNRTADANSAFEKLIQDFPDEKELVAKAREHLPSGIVLGPVPWVDGERLQLNMTLGGGLDVGTTEYYSDLAESDGRKVWRVGERSFAAVNSFSAVQADFGTFRPLTSRWKMLIGDVSATYKPGEVELRRAGVAEPTIVKLDEAVFDNEEAMDVMRRLPLKAGYKAKIPVFSSLGGATVPIELEVVGEEEIEAPAGQFKCFKTKLNIMGQTFWFSDDAHRYLVKFEANGLIAQLASISQRKPGEAITFHDDDLGVALTAPPNWVFYRPKNRVDTKNQVINMIDPEADSEAATVTLTPAASLSKEARESSRAWAESDFRESVSKRLKDAKIRPESWKDRDVSGRPGASYITDFTDLVSGQPQVAYALYALGPQTTVNFLLTCPPEKFDGLLASFESIVASYNTTK
jgi:tetratricopeptide (TPR) repeat protein